jgi:cytidyltransferase-like protein
VFVQKVDGFSFLFSPVEISIFHEYVHWLKEDFPIKMHNLFFTQRGTPFRQKFRVVSCEGCFDILHPGHIDFLERVKLYGGDKYSNFVICNVVSDKSYKDQKGVPPLLSEVERSKIVESLWCVDCVKVVDYPVENYDFCDISIWSNEWEKTKDETFVKCLNAAGDKQIFLPRSKIDLSSSKIKKKI